MRDRLAAYKLKVTGDRTAWQALRTLNLYRLFITLLFAVFFYTPLMVESLPVTATDTGRMVTGVLLLMAPVLFLIGQQVRRRPGLQSVIGLALDLWAILLVMRAVGGVSSGVGTLLVGSMMLSGVILPLRLSLLYAAAATIAILWQSAYGIIQGVVDAGEIAPAGILGAAYFATTLLGFYLATRARESQAVARQRSVELANLAQLNELIIERMRTGVMIVDVNDQAHLMNEAAWYLAGMPDQRSNRLSMLAPSLVDDLAHWRRNRSHQNQSRQLATGAPQVVPRFAPLSGDEHGDVLIFLEDTGMVSRRAQEMTLSSLGRLSASIAHEIRNPLGAISHSAQLLDESSELGDEDRQLATIIQRHCKRMNDIIENVLQLARQKPVSPEPVDLGTWIPAFVEDFLRYHEADGAEVKLLPPLETDASTALVDPSHLQQVLWNLCQNAIKYGREPDAPARVSIAWGGGSAAAPPWLEVRDRGRGIDEADRGRIFQPFFTTSAGGTGLGLYLCRQLLEANQADIEYRYDDTAGSRFRIEFTRSRPRSLPSMAVGEEGTDRQAGSAARARGETAR